MNSDASNHMSKYQEQDGNFTISAFIDRRVKNGNDTEVSHDESEAPCAPTAVGELRMIDTDSVKIGERFRRAVEVKDLAASIRMYGQVVPIMVRTDLTLVSGQRRLEACKVLGVQVFAHVVDVLDAEAAQIEEDRCRHQLTPYEMYRVTEALRPRLEDEAWARKVLGKKQYDKASKKGRVDEILAEHVSISRGTLRKIREIVGAWHTDPEKYQAVMDALEKDGRVDRHYKVFKVMSQPVYDGPKLTAVALAPNWQTAIAEDFAKVNADLDKANFKELAEEGAYLLVPSRIDSLPIAMALINRTGAKLQASFQGRNVGEDIILFARFGKAVEPHAALAAIATAAAKGVDTQTILGKNSDPSSCYVMTFAESNPARQ